MTRDGLLVASDLDGTLLSSSGAVGQETRRVLALLRAAGGSVAAVTSRPLRDTRNLVGDMADFLVCSGGAVVFETAGSRTLWSRELPWQQVQNITAALRRSFNRARLGFDHPNHCLLDDEFDLDLVSASGVCRTARAHTPTVPVLKILIQVPGVAVDEAARRVRGIVGAGVTVQTPSATFVEILPRGVDKGWALRRVCSGLPGRPRRIAFGDMPNDVPMLRWADVPVAVANAHPDAIANSRFRTGSNDDEGVAAFLRSLLSS